MKLFNYKKYEASLMIFLLVISTISFSISINSKVVLAAPKACCEKTTTGQFCQYTDASNCDASGKISYTGCEQTSYCRSGCCFSSDEGRCFKNTPRSTCELNNQTWRDDANCGVQQCAKGCCVLGLETFYVTQVRCKKETSKFPYANMTFLNVASEQECLDKSKSLEKGACVKEDGSCSFTTRGNCNLEQRQVRNISVGFYRDMLCSNDKLGANCAKQHRTACLGEDVYWFDSCGNQENIYSSNKEASYNNGFVLKEENSCISSGSNDPNCGNCDYLQGNLCGEANNTIRPVFGDYICKGLDCSKTTKSLSSPNAGVPHKYGESWCLYDAAVGQARDVVGSRHYRALCIGGEETIEECKDYREELCVQGIVGTEPQPNEIAFKARGSFVEAKCRENRNKECNACNAKESCGGECSGLPGDELKKCCAKKCCQNNDLRDCYWLEGGISSLGGVCVPEVPPGLKFWPGENSDKNQNSAPKSDASKVCDQASIKCTVTYKTGGIGKIFGSGKKDCVGNCNCLEHSWTVAANIACKAQGDCGAWYNIVGKLTTDGFSSSKDKLTQADIDKWDTIAAAPSKYKAPGFFKELSKRGILYSIIGIALAGGISAISGAGVSKGFSSAFNPISGTLFGAIGTGFQQSAINAFGGTTARFITEHSSIAPQELARSIGVNDAFDLKANGLPDFTKPSSAFKDAAELKNLKFDAETGKFIATKDTAVGNVGLAQGLQIINTLLWIYTLYQIADYILTKTKTEDIVATCNPWVAPEGGSDCEKCNQGPLKCSEYRCRSLGQTCKLINTGTSNEKCVNVAPNDVTSPIIAPWKEAITSGYQDIEQITNERGEKGYRITQLIKPFTPIALGIKTNEPAQCKYGLNHSIRYDKMQDTYFGDSLYDYNHTLTFSLPSELTQDQVLRLTNGGIFNLYIRCKDASGNANERDYFIRFQIDKSPDLTPPVIEATSILNNAFIPYGINSTQLSIYVNEPANCKWDKKDTEYEIMNNTLQCATTSSQVSVINYGTYECRTTIDGIKSPQTDYFFRCKDKPSAPEKERNVNSESYRFTLRATEKPLKLTSIEPSGTLYDANPIIRVVTEGGSSNGAAVCAYSNQNVQFNNMILFLETNGTIHRQPFNLTTGNYQYFVKCQDIAGNELSANTTFTIAVDTTPPRIMQLYKDVGASILHITLDEDSTCEFSAVDRFRFGDGTPMTGTGKDHELSISANKHFILCRDVFNNELDAVIYT